MVRKFIIAHFPGMGDVAGVVGMNEKQLKGSTAGLGFIYLRETAIDIKTYKSSNHHYQHVTETQ